MPRVSVVIPTYNQARFLNEAVGSVLAQTYRDVEVIVIDDGSTDGTPSLASTFPPSVTYFRQENQGSASARNRGIELSKGEYIAFLDSDDVLLEDSLEKSLIFLDQHPEVGFCGGQFYTIDENGHLLRQRRPRGPRATFIRDGKEEIAHLLVGTGGMHLSTTLVRHSCFSNVGLFNTALRIHQDLDMLIRLAKRFSVGYLAEPLAKVRFHNNSITAISGIEAIREPHITVLESVFGDEEIGYLYSHLRKEAYFNLYCLFSRVSARTGHPVAALSYSAKAIKTCPGQLFSIKGISLLMSSMKDFVPRYFRRILVRILMFIRLR